MMMERLDVQPPKYASKQPPKLRQLLIMYTIMMNLHATNRVGDIDAMFANTLILLLRFSLIARQ